MITTSKYPLYYSHHIIHAQSQETHRICPICQKGILKIRDTRLRTIIDLDPGILKIRVHRYQYPTCNRLHSEVPDFIVPYKRYTREEILATITNHLSSCPAENSTIRRWISDFQKTDEQV